MENIERPAEISKAQKQVMSDSNQQKYTQDQLTKIYDYLDKLNGEGLNIDRIYPVGSIYISVNNTNPSTIFGGEWEQIQDRFLLSAGNTYQAGATGGEASHKLVNNELPKLSGSITMHSASSGTNIHQVGGIITSTSTVSNTYRDGGSQNSGANSFGSIKVSFGNDQAHNNMPPYLVVYMWKRIN